MAEIIQHNFIVCLMEFIIISALCYLSLKIYPLLILKIILIICAILIIFCPYLLNHVNSPYQILLIQFIISLLDEGIAPAFPIFYKSFPVFKRFTCVSITFAISRALMYAVTSFGFVYLIEHFGNWGLWIIMIPTIIGFAYGLFYFDKLAKELGGYPLAHKDVARYQEETII